MRKREKICEEDINAWKPRKEVKIEDEIDVALYILAVIAVIALIHGIGYALDRISW